jgi:uncharacterized protein (TIGR02271 family)
MDTYDKWIGADLYDTTDTKIGTIDNLYVDTQTKQPTWIETTTGFFGTKHTYVPIESAYVHEGNNDYVYTGYERSFVKDAPHFDEGQILSDADERALYEYYGLTYDTVAHSDDHHGTAHTDGHDHDHTHDKINEHGVTRSEEEVSVGTRSVESGTVRLHKFVTTESVDLTVPVRKEHVRVIRTPVTDGTTGSEIDSEETIAEVTVREEVPVVQKETVAKEHVTLEKSVETDEAHVHDTVKKEHIEVEETDRNR